MGIANRQPTATARLPVVLMLGLLLGGCSHLPEWTYWSNEEPEPASEAEMEDGRNVRQRAMSRLHRGDADTAEQLLRERLETVPHDERATALLRQIEADPEDYLGKESFPYRVQAGESLTVLAQRFLGDHREFFILARYNKIGNPSRLRVGQTLRIPTDFREGPGEAAVRVDRNVRARQALEAGEVTTVIRLYADQPHPALDTEDRELLGHAHREHIGAALSAGELDQASTRLESAREHPAAEGLWADWLDDLAGRIHARRAHEQGREKHVADPVVAAEAYRTALRHDPGYGDARAALDELQETVVPELHREAVLLYRNQSLDEAIELWDQVLSIDPDFERARVYRTRAVELRQRLESLE